MLFDIPPVVASAGPVLQAAGFADRCQTVAGDFFDQVPPGGDRDILSNIITTGRRERAADPEDLSSTMAANSRLLIIELVLPDDARPSMGKLLDLEMLSVTPNGRQRTEAQYAMLLGSAALQATAVVPALPGSAASYVEAAPSAESDSPTRATL